MSLNKDNIEIDLYDGETKDIVDTDGLLTLSDSINIMKNSGYPEHIINQLIKIQADAKTYNELDHELIKVLTELSECDKVPLYNTPSDAINNINESSYIIYFKKAGMFKVYTPTILQQYFHGQLATILKKNTEIYEVVDRSKPQKILIIIDGSIENELNKIRDYIFNYFHRYDNALNLSDIISFKNPITKNLEILINGMYVKNYEDKEKFINQLLKYIEDEERKLKFSFDLGKIEPRRFCEIPDVDMVLVPQRKECTSSVDTILKYVSNTTDCRLLGGNVTINVNNIIGNHNTIKNVNNSVVYDDSGDDLDDIQKFINYLLTNEPEWYKPGKWVHISELYEKFIEICSSSITITKFSKEAMDKLYSRRDNRRINNKQGRAVLLFKYDKLLNV